MKIITDFFQNGYYHCLHYIVDRNLYWIERLFWIFWVILSMGGVLYIVDQSVEHFYSTKASLRVRTDYLDFKTPFPAIFFCEKEEIRGKIPEMLDRLNYTIGRSFKANVEVFVRTATFIRPLDTFRSFPSCGTDEEACRFVDTYKNNLSTFSKYIRATCEEIFTSCTINGEEFDCCKRLLPVDTFEGKCYAINSYNALFEQRPELINLIQKNYETLFSNRRRTNITFTDYLEPKPGKNPANLSIELAHANLYAWFLGNNYLPTKMYQKNNQFDVMKTSKFLDVNLRVQEILPDISISNLELRRRNCRFSYENSEMKSLQIYSISGCEIDCLREAQLSYCGCVLHLLPNQKGLEQKLCGTDKIQCTTKKDIAAYLAFNCSCITTCDFMEVFSVGFVGNVASRDNDSFRDPRSVRRINFLVRAPTVQYHLYANQEPLDFIVSIGGAISLCIGCSFLSLVQIIYYFCLKPCNDTLTIRRKRKMTQKKINIQNALWKQKNKQIIGKTKNTIHQQVGRKIATLKGY